MAKTPTDIRSLARGHTRKALNVLASIMSAEDANPSARVSAASALLDRGWGKPDQHSTVDVLKRDATDYTRDELVAIIHDAAKGSGRAAKANGREPESDKLH